MELLFRRIVTLILTISKDLVEEKTGGTSERRILSDFVAILTSLSICIIIKICIVSYDDHHHLYLDKYIIEIFFVSFFK